jgi:hypothetical protein
VDKTEGVGAILERCVTSLVANWLERTKQIAELNQIQLSDEERTHHLPKLVEDLVVRLSKVRPAIKGSDAAQSPSAAVHGQLRHGQGYSAPMLIEESRILQVTIFDTLRENLNGLDFNVVLTDIMTIADEVDSQLTQSMTSFMELRDRRAVA